MTATEHGRTLTLAGDIGHLPFGPLKALQYGNGLSLTLGYDLLHRVSDIAAENAVQLGYSLNPAGNIAAITDRLDAGSSQSFGYDPQGRLTSAIGSYGTLGWTYDKVGNRLSETSGGVTSGYTYASGSNRIASISGPSPLSFTHDAAGSVTAMGNRTLSWDADRCLCKVSEDGHAPESGSGTCVRY